MTTSPVYDLLDRIETEKLFYSKVYVTNIYKTI